MRRKLMVSMGVLVTAGVLAACSGQSGTGAGTSTASSPSAAAETTSSAAPGAGEHAGHGSAGEQSPAAAPAPAAPAAGAMTIDVTVSGGKVRTPKALVDVPVGSPVDLVVTSDVADEVHVHGYNELVDVTPGTPAHVGFTASIPGVFEVEMESAKLRLLQLRVQ